ncbi:hypothetical protein B0H15DRAFT_1024637 [Mycena belliarum]|uniref:Uncharacterized protein n=1 Tax=Mycena belliarum TaxID=1033014 RepID=A0AAD6U229_9AGAR|nr:hypothetical protein B0H15DRAFT_974519 [Mycena belliae]KAJ7082073.1 hypothetical protein B0H15DRAFT_1024637 [Mycena belliae]
MSCLLFAATVLRLKAQQMFNPIESDELSGSWDDLIGRRAADERPLSSRNLIVPTNLGLTSRVTSRLTSQCIARCTPRASRAAAALPRPRRLRPRHSVYTRLSRSTAAASEYPCLRRLSPRHSARTRRLQSTCWPSPRLKRSPAALLCTTPPSTLPYTKSYVWLPTPLRKPRARLEQPVPAPSSLLALSQCRGCVEYEHRRAESESSPRRRPKTLATPHSFRTAAARAPCRAPDAARESAGRCARAAPASGVAPSAPSPTIGPVPPTSRPTDQDAVAVCPLTLRSGVRVLCVHAWRKSTTVIYTPTLDVCAGPAQRRRRHPMCPCCSAQAHGGLLAAPDVCARAARSNPSASA